MRVLTPFHLKQTCKPNLQTQSTSSYKPFYMCIDHVLVYCRCRCVMFAKFMIRDTNTLTRAVLSLSLCALCAVSLSAHVRTSSDCECHRRRNVYIYIYNKPTTRGEVCGHDVSTHRGSNDRCIMAFWRRQSGTSCWPRFSVATNMYVCMCMYRKHMCTSHFVTCIMQKTCGWCALNN